MNIFTLSADTLSNIFIVLGAMNTTNGIMILLIERDMSTKDAIFTFYTPIVFGCLCAAMAAFGVQTEDTTDRGFVWAIMVYALGMLVWSGGNLTSLFGQDKCR